MKEADATACATVLGQFSAVHALMERDAAVDHATADADASTAAFCACSTPLSCASSMPETKASATASEALTVGASASDTATTPASESRYCVMESPTPSTSGRMPLM